MTEHHDFATTPAKLAAARAQLAIEADHAANRPVLYETNELPAWITITECGEENMYFTCQDGSRGYAKTF